MTPAQQAARDVVDKLRADLALSRSYGGPSPGERDIEQQLKGAEAVLAALRTTPPAAAPAITQEQAREMAAILRLCLNAAMAVPKMRGDLITAAEPHIRAALAGAPRE